MKYFNLLDWAMKYQKKFRELGRGLWESGNTAETVVLLSQRKPDAQIEVNLEMSELEQSSTEIKATYEEIKSFVLEKHGLKVTNLYIAQLRDVNNLLKLDPSNMDIGPTSCSRKPIRTAALTDTKTGESLTNA